MLYPITTISPLPISGEIILPGETVDVAVCLNLFSSSHTVVKVPVGSTVRECVDAAYDSYDGSLPAHTEVIVGTTPVPSCEWDRVRVKSGAFVAVRGVPGKDSGMMRTLLLVAVAVAAIAATFLLGPAGFALVTATTASLIGTAILIGGSLLINALIPIRPPVLDKGQSGAGTSTTYSISGGSNEADPFGPVPFVLGTHRQHPKYAARAYTEFRGDKQYLTMLFCWGYSKVNISNFKIGETDLGDFSKVQIEHDFNYVSGNETMDLFPGEVIEDQLNIELTRDGTTVYNQRTTASETDRIAVDLVFPSGIYETDPDTGKRLAFKLNVKIQYKRTTDSAWKSFDNEFNWNDKRLKPIRQSFKQSVSRGQYDVRVGRTTDDGDVKNVVDDGAWTALRSYRNDPPIEFSKNLAVTALDIKASGQLSGVVSSFNGIVSSKQLSYNGSTWVADQVSSNPATLFRYALQGPFNERPVADAQIDLTKIEAWWTYCDDNEFEFNMVRDFRSSVWDLVSDIAAAGRAFPCFVDGKWSVVWDDPTAPVTGHYSTRNSRNFTEEKQFSRLAPQAYRVRFINEDQGYKEDEVIVYDDGYDDDNTTRYEQIEFPGITNADLAWRFGRYYIAQLRLRPSIYSLIVAREHFRNTVGDRVRVQHYLPLWGLVSGRVTAVNGSVITVDELTTMEPAKSYSVRFTQPGTGTTFTRTVPTVAGNSFDITVDAGSGTIAIGDHFSFGETGLETVILRIKKIQYMDEQEAKIFFQDDAPEIADADQGAIPPFNSRVTLPPSSSSLTTKLSVKERTPAPGDTQTTGVIVTVVPPTYSSNVNGSTPIAVEYVQVEYKNSTEDEEEYQLAGYINPPASSLNIDDLDPGTWDFRARSVFNNGVGGAWVYVEDFAIVGVDAIPEDVVNFIGSVNTDFVRFSWDAALYADHYVVRYSPNATGAATWASAQVVADNIKETNLFLPTLIGTYLIKGVNKSGVESTAEATFINVVEGLRGLNAIVTIQEEPTWVGEKIGVEVDASTLRLTQVGGLLSWPPMLEVTEEHWTTVFPDVGYFWPEVTDLGESFTSRVTVNIAGNGENVSNVIGSWGPIGGVGLIGGSEADKWAAFYEERHISETAVIDRTTGTNIGTMTAGGGLAASYDGESSETAANSSSIASATSGYVGKTLAINKKISHVVVWGSSDQGLSLGTTVTLELYGKLGGAPASATDGTLLYSRTVTDITGALRWVLVNEVDTVTAWSHVWVRFSAGSNTTFYCAELEMYENTGAGWSDWAEIKASQDYTFRFFERRLVLQSFGNNIRPVLTAAGILIDMPDTFRADSDITIASDGMRVTYDPPFRIFAGVGISPMVQNNAVRLVISNADETGFNITAKDAADAFVGSQKFAYNAKGAGAQVS